MKKNVILGFCFSETRTDRNKANRAFFFFFLTFAFFEACHLKRKNVRSEVDLRDKNNLNRRFDKDSLGRIWMVCAIYCTQYLLLLIAHLGLLYRINTLILCLTDRPNKSAFV